MANHIWYVFIYLFEVLAVFMFFENFYQKKSSKICCFLVYLVSFVILFSVNFITLPFINLIAFVICTALISLTCYQSKIRSCIFTSLMLSFFMFITEIIILYASSFILNIGLAAYKENILTFVAQSSLSKLLFFLVVFFISKYFKNKENKQSPNKFTILLGILPLTSMSMFTILYCWGGVASSAYNLNAALSVCAILLLFANLFVFYIYELVQKSNLDKTQHYLDKQKSEISAEYYGLLSEEYEKSRILIHDIKNHLRYIENKTNDGKTNEVIDYIDSIREDFGLNERIRYSGNGLIDVIINRHANFCKSNGLKFEVEACCSKLEFMNDSDITALLDNLLDNAIESALNSIEKKIVFSIYVRNDTFVVITVTNSCDIPPKSSNGKLISSKNNLISHGYGTKSIRRVVNKYDGDFSWNYDDINHEFEATAILLDKNMIEKINTNKAESIS